MLAALFALILQTSNYGNYWTTPSWCPKSTDSRLTPGSDAFVKEDNYQLTTNGAAAFYSVLDAFDTRKFVFSNGSTNISKHIVASRGLDNYDAFIDRRDSLKSLSCFGDGYSLAGGETFDKWMLANGYAAFNGYDWQANPFPDPSAKSVVWFPNARIFGSDDIFTGDGGMYANIAKTVLEAVSYIPLGWNDWYGHDWNADYLDEHEGSFKVFLTNAYERVWFDGMTNNSRVIDWKPIEMAAKVLGTYDKLYVVSEGQPFSAITNFNSVSGSVTYRTEGSTVSRVRFDGVSPLGEIIVVDTGSGALPIGSVTETSKTEVGSLPSSSSCPSIDVTSVRASGSIGAEIQIGTFSAGDEWESALGEYLYWKSGQEAEIVSTFGKHDGLYINVVGDISFSYSHVAEDEILAESGMLEMPVTGYARARYSAMDSVVSSVPGELSFCTISTNVTSYVTNVNYFAFMSASNTADGVAYKCAKYDNRTIRGQSGFGPTLRSATQTLDERVGHGLEANVYDATEYCNFSESDARRIWGMCDEPSLSVVYGDGSSASVVTNYAVVVPVFSEGVYSVNVISGTVQTAGNIYVRLDGGSASIADRRDAYHGDSKCAWVSEANVGNVPLRQTSGGERMRKGTLKLTSEYMPRYRCYEAFKGLDIKKADASEPIYKAGPHAFERAFVDCAQLETVDFSELTNAQANCFTEAFHGCGALKTLYFSNLETSNKAFSNAFDAACHNINTISFPSLKNIAKNEFTGCFRDLSKLRKLQLLSLENAPEGSFEKCCLRCGDLSAVLFNSLTNASKNAFISAFDTCGWDNFGVEVKFPLLTDANENAFNAAFEVSKISSTDFHSLKYAGKHSFDMAFTSSDMPSFVRFSSLTNADDFAFYGSFKGTKLIGVSFPMLKIIGDGAFSNAFDSLTFVHTNNVVNPPVVRMASLGTASTSPSLAAASSGNDSPAPFSMPFANVETIGKGAFYGAFSNATNLRDVSFAKLKVAPESAFERSFMQSSVSNVNFAALKDCRRNSFKASFLHCPSVERFALTITNADASAFYGAFYMGTNANRLCDVRFPSLEKAASNAFGNAFYGCMSLTNLNFASLRRADGVFAPRQDEGQYSFAVCTNLQYASFDNMESGYVDLSATVGDWSSASTEAPLVISCSNVSATAVVDISKRKNVKEIRFDTVSAIVNYDSRWIPQNADWKAYVPKDLLLAWRAADGWSAYSANIVTTGKLFTPWVATVSGSTSGTPTGFIQDYVNQHPEYWEYNAERGDWWWLGPSIPDPNIGGSWSFDQTCHVVEGVGADATKIDGGYFDNNGDHAYVSAERSEIAQ